MNLNTEEGMKEAIQWQRALIDSLVDGGTWVVPRSGTIITFNKQTRTATFTLQGDPEPDIQRVLLRMGWDVVESK